VIAALLAATVQAVEPPPTHALTVAWAIAAGGSVRYDVAVHPMFSVLGQVGIQWYPVQHGQNQVEAHVKVGGDLRPLEPGAERLYLGPRLRLTRRDAADAFLAGTGRPAEWQTFTSFIVGFRWIDDFGVVGQLGAGPALLWPLTGRVYEPLYPAVELRVGGAWPTRAQIERQRW
jgi:hypothetical protein